jgi:hypothetical protein
LLTESKRLTNFGVRVHRVELKPRKWSIS